MWFSIKCHKQMVTGQSCFCFAVAVTHAIFTLQINSGDIGVDATGEERQLTTDGSMSTPVQLTGQFQRFLLEFQASINIKNVGQTLGA